MKRQGKQTPFVGQGPSPDGVDLPQGLSNRLAQDPTAMQTFGQMSTAQKAQMVAHIQGATSGDDARRRIGEALDGLHSGQWS